MPKLARNTLQKQKDFFYINIHLYLQTTLTLMVKLITDLCEHRFSISFHRSLILHDHFQNSHTLYKRKVLDFF